MLTRREFLQASGAAIAAGAVLPSFLTRAAWAADAGGGTSAYGPDTILVVVQMQGGNDGLNTVVPYGLDGYREARPAIGIADSEVLPLTDEIGLHPAMSQLYDRYQAGQVAIVQGVSYPNPDLSHFRATDIWLSAVPDHVEKNGWLADYLAANPAATANPLYAASVTDTLSNAFAGKGVLVPAIPSIPAYQLRTDPRYPNDRDNKLNFARWVAAQDYGTAPLQKWVANTMGTAISTSEAVQAIASGATTAVDYPRFALANSLKIVAQLMAGGLGTRVYYVLFGGFDTHTSQPKQQAALLGGFSDSVEAFLQDVAGLGIADNVLLLTFSEFGRRVNENASQGTDHGTAAPMFAIGPRVKGGLYGDHPSLTALDENKNLNFGIDFRAVYSTALAGWLGADAESVLGQRFENVGFV
ncbi:MAG: DUF1501 domain-containing protein [Chloroflexi bacterium]|nr:DUF1501 domain-containing protein [Chloroflexota bacterium]